MGGYVGEGLLTAAVPEPYMCQLSTFLLLKYPQVAGGVFASPAVPAILQAIRTVTGPKGTLLMHGPKETVTSPDFDLWCGE